MREEISCKLKFDYGNDESGKSKGTWSFSKVLPNSSAQAAFLLAGGLNTLQENSDASYYRVAEYKISR